MMTIKDLLQALKAEREETRKIVEASEKRLEQKIENDVTGAEKRLEQKIENDVTGAEKRLEQKIESKVEASEKRLNGSIVGIGQKVEREVEDIVGMFHETWKFIDKQTAELKAEIHSEKFKQIEERLAKLEKHAGISSNRS